MSDLEWATGAAMQWVAIFGGEVVGLSRQSDGRWFAEVVTDEPNWCSERYMLTRRFADLGVPPSSKD